MHTVEAHNETFQAGVINVVQTLHERGDGSPGNPRRNVLQIWAPDGRLIAESDPVLTYCEHCKTNHFAGLNTECKF